jgi:hypothetical protein
MLFYWKIEWITGDLKVDEMISDVAIEINILININDFP